MINRNDSEPPQPVTKADGLVRVASTALLHPLLFCIFHGRNGYDSDRETANRLLVIGKQYRVIAVSMSSSMTYITLEGERRSFNSVMFDVDHDALIRWAFPENNENGHSKLELLPQSRLWWPSSRYA